MTNGETSIITQLVEQVSALVATDRERENTRVLLRAQDNHWRDRMEKKTDELVNGLTDLGRRLEDLPSTMDQRVRDKLTAHEDAEKMAARTARSWISCSSWPWSLLSLQRWSSSTVRTRRESSSPCSPSVVRSYSGF